MTSDAQRCAECRYMRASADPRIGGDSTICARFPPTPLLIGASIRDSDSTVSARTIGVFPQTHPDAWCGEFAPRTGWH